MRNLERRHDTTLVSRLEKVGAMISKTASTKAYNKNVDANREHYPIYRLIDEYEELKSELQRRGIWAVICTSRGWSPAHSGWDLTC